MAVGLAEIIEDDNPEDFIKLYQDDIKSYYNLKTR